MTNRAIYYRTGPEREVDTKTEIIAGKLKVMPTPTPML